VLDLHISRFKTGCQAGSQAGEPSLVCQSYRTDQDNLDKKFKIASPLNILIWKFLSRFFSHVQILALQRAPRVQRVAGLPQPLAAHEVARQRQVEGRSCIQEGIIDAGLSTPIGAAAKEFVHHLPILALNVPGLRVQLLIGILQVHEAGVGSR
ncbi:uncharacterized protein METZ01_LOCUS462753, partial [marine metagenome]